MNHLGVRDTPRTTPDLRQRYGTLKRQQRTSAANIEENGKGKNALLQESWAIAGPTDAQRITIDTAQMPSLDEAPR